MLEIIFSIFKTIVHGVVTIVKLIISIPSYVLFVGNVINYLPSFILIPLSIALLASVIIAIKRLVI